MTETKMPPCLLRSATTRSYIIDLSDFSGQTRALLEDYSRIPSSDVLRHVAEIVSQRSPCHTLHIPVALRQGRTARPIKGRSKKNDFLKNLATISLQDSFQQRDKAWAIRSYPCTGLGLWLNPMIPKTPSYAYIIERLQAGSTFLDIGCFLGQDLRRLVADGAPPDNLYAMDIVSHWDVGYDLFRDRDRFSAHFLEADVLFPNSTLTALRGKVDILYITHVLHQWDWETQVKCLVQLVGLSSGPGAIVVGFQVGSVGERNILPSGLAKSDAYWHNPRSFAEIWDRVSRETGTRWESKASLMTWEEVGWDPKDIEYLGSDARVIQFVVSCLG